MKYLLRKVKQYALYSYRGADKSLARPGRKQAMFLSEWREFPSAPCLAGEKQLDSSHLDVVEIARVPDMLPSLFPSWSDYGLISTPVIILKFSYNQPIFRHVSVIRYVGPLKHAGIWTDCVGIFESLNVWRILLDFADKHVLEFSVK